MQVPEGEQDEWRKYRGLQQGQPGREYRQQGQDRATAEEGHSFGHFRPEGRAAGSGPTDGPSVPAGSGPTDGPSVPAGSGPTDGPSVPAGSGPTDGPSVAAGL